MFTVAARNDTNQTWRVVYIIATNSYGGRGGRYLLQRARSTQLRRSFVDMWYIDTVVVTCTELSGHWRLFVLVTCARLSWSHSAFESTLNSSIASHRIVSRGRSYSLFIRRHRWYRYRFVVRLSVCLSVGHVRALCSNGRRYRMHTTALPCLSHIVLKIGLHRSTPSSL